MEVETPCIGWALALYTNIILMLGFPLKVARGRKIQFVYNDEDLVEW